MDIKVIKTREEYEEALERFAVILEQNPVPGSPLENVLELLLVVIRDYEQRVGEPLELDPIESIKFRMEQMELSRKELVPYLGSLSKVSEVLSGKRDLSLSMVRNLHEGLGIPFESLLVRRKVSRRQKPIKQRKKRSLSLRKRTQKA